VTIKTRSGFQYQQLIGNNGTAQSERILHFGLGSDKKALTVEVLWPSGNTSSYRDLPSGRHNLTEPEKKLSSL
jgi:5-deoxy-D-glucuronate isomerase